MSWRLWHQQKKNKVDNNIASLLLSPATSFVHDAYSHEVSQSTQKCYESTIQHHASSSNQQQQEKDASLLSRSSSFCKVVYQDTKLDVKQLQNEEEDEDDEDDDDYYLSEDDIYEDDEEEDYCNEINYHFVQDFKKTQPRPATPKRSLLSDLLQRVSSPPSLLSNSSCSFASNSTSTHHSSILLDDYNNNNNNNNTKHSSITTTTKLPVHLTTTATTTIATNKNHANDIQHDVKWRESFHGW